MPKNKGTSTREAKVAKAGKRSGSFTEPPRPDQDKQNRRFMGEQQFYAPRQQTLKVTKENFIVWDKPSKSFVYRPKTEIISVEFTMDPSRGRVVTSPANKERDK